MIDLGDSHLIIFFSNVLLQNTLLMELTEEWEQYEKKIKDVHGWIKKSRSTFESPQYKNRPLRDQLGYLEKTLADIATQKTKISISYEKLQVSCENTKENSTTSLNTFPFFHPGALPYRIIVRKRNQR